MRAFHHTRNEMNMKPWCLNADERIREIEVRLFREVCTQLAATNV
jgi:hypothetical protein